MRTMIFMSRILGMVIVMITVLLTVFVLLDIMREGPHARGFLIGTDVWKQVRDMADHMF